MSDGQLTKDARAYLRLMHGKAAKHCGVQEALFFLQNIRDEPHKGAYPLDYEALRLVIEEGF